MNVEISHHVDADEPAEDGTHEYHYEYDIFRFTEGAVTLFARSYVDTPDEANFLSVIKNEQRQELAEYLDSALFLQAVAYFRQQGKQTIGWLSRKHGYKTFMPSESAPQNSHSLEVGGSMKKWWQTSERGLYAFIAGAVAGWGVLLGRWFWLSGGLGVSGVLAGEDEISLLWLVLGVTLAALCEVAAACFVFGLSCALWRRFPGPACSAVLGCGSTLLLAWLLW
jgi:hypothetical protein